MELPIAPLQILNFQRRTLDFDAVHSNANPEQNLSVFQPNPDLKTVQIGGRAVPIDYVRNHRARRYIIRLAAGGRVRATIPPFGSKREAYAFAEREWRWIERQLNKAPVVSVGRPVSPAWTEG